jgi:hypothetical protein
MRLATYYFLRASATHELLRNPIRRSSVAFVRHSIACCDEDGLHGIMD